MCKYWVSQKVCLGFSIPIYLNEHFGQPWEKRDGVKESKGSVLNHQEASVQQETVATKFYPCLTSIIGEGNGNPLQYPCLENPMDGGA